ncbi:unnamed protein product [Durusdinium trenchii]|uniref:Uncharacterized protein n=1 Tax=Durusdinium trenchii TaxID=1381693 RepID=A0ABP0IX08_9DINO
MSNSFSNMSCRWQMLNSIFRLLANLDMPCGSISRAVRWWPRRVRTKQKMVLLVRPCLAGGDSGPLRIGALTRLPPRYMSGSSHPKGNRRMVRREHLRFEYTAKEHKGMVKLGKSDVVVRPLGHEGAACSSPCSRDDSAKFRRWLIQLYRESEQPVMAT